MLDWINVITCCHDYLQGVVIGVGEMSEFGSVFKMMQSEEVRHTLIDSFHSSSCQSFTNSNV